MQSITLASWIFGFAVDLAGWPGFILCNEFIFYHRSQSDAKTITFYSILAAFLTWKIFYQRLLTSIQVATNFHAFEYIRLLLNVFKRLVTPKDSASSSYVWQ